MPWLLGEAPAAVVGGMVGFDLGGQMLLQKGAQVPDAGGTSVLLGMACLGLWTVRRYRTAT